MKIAFLGAGKMATSLARGLVEKNTFPVSAISAVDISPEARDAFTAKTGVLCSSTAVAALDGAQALVLAVKPQYARGAVAPIADLCAEKLVISIAAGLPLARLAGWFRHARIVRVMPNTPAMVGYGAAVFSCAAGVSSDDRELVRSIFAAVGIVQEMPEEKQDAVTALSGSGPAYMFELIRVLVAGAEKIGLDAEDALQLITQTMAGAAEMVRQGLGTPEELRIAVTSPGGTTAAGLAMLEDSGFAGLWADVLQAARNRSIELGQA